MERWECAVAGRGWGTEGRPDSGQCMWVLEGAATQAHRVSLDPKDPDFTDLTSTLQGSPLGTHGIKWYTPTFIEHLLYARSDGPVQRLEHHLCRLFYILYFSLNILCVRLPRVQDSCNR